MNIEKIEERGFRVGVPIPFPMRYMYSYLLKDYEHYVLIDVGLNNKEAKDYWLAVFAELQIEPTMIKTIYLTHFHPDHSGLAGWMQELTGAELFMHEIDKKMLEQVFATDSNQSALLKDMFVNYGVPNQLSEDIQAHMDQLAKYVQPLPKIQCIREKIVINGQSWEVIHSPGHSDGHICLYQRDDRLMIVGDHLLDKITPNISVWPHASQKPLHEYMESLYKIKKLEVELILSAHGSLITDHKLRADEIIRHHQKRLAKIEQLSYGQTAYQIAEQLFAHKKLTAHQWRFAIAETIAHIVYLVDENRLIQSKATPHIYRMNQ
ncbi:MBL fold metallo-hydrolase [Alkalihalobacillus pseudalcaliphilus]|uniref:MBL fold metallo-hydrolase n=1 Tax=Alkalihalobacillus pseudalcaliphilus TaxID=79884 RepID=UPI00064D9ABD|nr:MBL fold metallo-hydrolase [Alkalihalobacillus pseudalcaliphilus]KMK77195.1 lactamase [Alkalihalobacillus pseudalcaliphilus]